MCCTRLTLHASLNMNLVMVTDSHGNRWPQMHWQVNR
jgi:hypothetical protein